MEENPYEPPTIEADASESRWLRWVNAILQAVVTIFLALMTLSSMICFILGTFALQFGNTLPGTALLVSGLAIGLLTFAAAVQFVRQQMRR